MLFAPRDRRFVLTPTRTITLHRTDNNKKLNIKDKWSWWAIDLWRHHASLYMYGHDGCNSRSRVITMEMWIHGILLEWGGGSPVKCTAVCESMRASQVHDWYGVLTQTANGRVTTRINQTWLNGGLTLVECWPNVNDVGPTFNQRWLPNQYFYADITNRRATQSMVGKHAGHAG